MNKIVEAAKTLKASIKCNNCKYYHDGICECHWRPEKPENACEKFVPKTDIKNILSDFPQDEERFFIAKGLSDEEISALMDIAELYGSDIIIIFDSDKYYCVFFDGRWQMGYEEGSDRIHDEDHWMSREEVFKWLKENKELRIAVQRYTRPYIEGVDWFT
jgi:predicted DNA binding protein